MISGVFGGFCPKRILTISLALNLILRPLYGLLWPGLAQNRAASRAFPGRGPSATRPSSCVGPTPPETRQTLRQKLPVDALRQVWQDGGAMNENEKRFSFTREAPSTSGRAKKQILIS